jgi:hypothetical protein
MHVARRDCDTWVDVTPQTIEQPSLTSLCHGIGSGFIRGVSFSTFMRLLATAPIGCRQEPMKRAVAPTPPSSS